MKRPIRPILGGLAAAALAATLGACHQQPKAGHGEISGQILPGSVSDAMLPYDAVKSKAPLAPREAVEQADNGSDNGPADNADNAVGSDSAASEIPASPAPTALPTPAAVNQ